MLAAELADGIDVPAALMRYDQQRRPRSQHVQRTARQDPAISLSTNPVVYEPATKLTKLAGDRVAARKSARLWHWTPPVLDTHPTPIAAPPTGSTTTSAQHLPE